ncbi:MAG: hypothetical protein Q9169_001799 [Polycauliona sp. 2 TL-2023]
MEQTNWKKLYPVEPVLIPTLKAGAVSATRGAILRAWQVTADSPPQDRIYPSTIAGGFTGGTIGGLTRGRANIIPGIIMFSLFGFAGQYAYNALDARHHNLDGPSTLPTTQSTSTAGADRGGIEAQDFKSEDPLWKRALNSKWSPMKVLSDEQYEKMLRTKLLRVEAELAIVDEDIEKVKQTERDEQKEKKDSKD